MADICVLEGGRMQWKSTIAQGLRQSTEGSTLINFTGFKLDGQDGHTKVFDYYWNFLHMFPQLPADTLIICDRLFFSELVYSRLYKSYDFSRSYLSFLRLLAHRNNRVRIFHLTANRESLAARLGREKMELFGRVGDSLDELIKQRDMYDRVMAEASAYYETFHETVKHDVYIKKVDTTDYDTSKEVQDFILKSFQKSLT